MHPTVASGSLSPVEPKSTIYGINPVLEAIDASVEIDAVYLAVGLRAATRSRVEQAARRRKLRVFSAPRRELDSMAGGGMHQGVVAVCERLHYVDLDFLMQIEKKPRSVIVCLDGVQDPRNLGALARSALAFGAVGMVIPTRRSASLSPGAMKASAGALAHLPVARVTNLAVALDKMKKNGFWVAGAVVSDSGANVAQAPADCDPGEKLALVLGGEGTGLRRGVEGLLDFRVRIPISGEMESLNVSVAGAILLYEWLRPNFT